MKKIIGIIGVWVYWVFWPVLYLILNNSKRTRVLLISGNEVLLLRSWIGDGGWSLPGGGIRSNEEPSISAIREIREEAGLDISANDLILLGTVRLQRNKTKSISTIFAYVFNDKPTIKTRFPETIDSRWVDISQINGKRFLNDVHEAVNLWQKKK